MGLYYSKESKSQLIGYADAGYLSDPHIARSQMGYVFTYNDTTISWRSVKQTMIATSSNHSEILASHKCVWLRSMIHIFKKHVDYLPSKAMQPNYMKIMLLVLTKLKEVS